MRNDMPSWVQRLAVQALLVAGLACGSAAQAQSEASAALSLMPVASVVVASGAASATAGAVVALPVALSVGGAVLTVKAVQASATGTVIVLERASDGAQASIELKVITEVTAIPMPIDALRFFDTPKKIHNPRNFVKTKLLTITALINKVKYSIMHHPFLLLLFPYIRSAF